MPLHTVTEDGGKRWEKRGGLTGKVGNYTVFIRFLWKYCLRCLIHGFWELGFAVFFVWCLMQCFCWYCFMGFLQVKTAGSPARSVHVLRSNSSDWACWESKSIRKHQSIPSLKLTACPWKWMVGILYTFLLGWPIFRGELLVSGSVVIQTNKKIRKPHHWYQGRDEYDTVSHTHLCRMRLTSLHIWQYVCHSLCLHSLLFAHIFWTRNVSKCSQEVPLLEFFVNDGLQFYHLGNHQFLLLHAHQEKHGSWPFLIRVSSKVLATKELFGFLPGTLVNVMFYISLFVTNILFSLFFGVASTCISGETNNAVLFDGYIGLIFLRLDSQRVSLLCINDGGHQKGIRPLKCCVTNWWMSFLMVGLYVTPCLLFWTVIWWITIRSSWVLWKCDTYPEKTRDLFCDVGSSKIWESFPK